MNMNNNIKEMILKMNEVMYELSFEDVHQYMLKIYKANYVTYSDDKFLEMLNSIHSQIHFNLERLN